MMFNTVDSYNEFLKIKESEKALLLYFSTDNCNVCKVLKPKVAKMLETQFPQIKPVYIQSDKLPEIAAQNGVFAVPTILVFFEGREYIRKSRNIGLLDLASEIGRPYSMIFDES